MEEIKSFEDHYGNKRIVLKDAIPLKLPLCISLEASNICNFSCIMCSHGNKRYAEESKPLKNMNMELFSKCVDEINAWCHRGGKNEKIRLMKLYSIGEPLLNSHIGDMVRMIKEADICRELEITSNSSLLTEKLGKQFVDYGLDIYRASIYSVDDEKNKRITRSEKFTPQDIANNIWQMRQYRDAQKKKKPFISAKMIDSYSSENERFIEMYSKIADEAYLDKLMLSPDGTDTVSQYYEGNAKAALNDADRVKQAYRRACYYPFTHMVVKSDGMVAVCCADWLKKTVIGNVNETSLEKIWNGKKLYDFRCMMICTKGLNHELCKNCEIPLRKCDDADDVDDVPLTKLSYIEGGENL